MIKQLTMIYTSCIEKYTGLNHKYSLLRKDLRKRRREMKKTLVLSVTFIILLALWAFGPIAYASAGFARDAQTFYKMNQNIALMLEETTVWIVTHHDDSLTGGTGFIVGYGYIMTNAHVVDKPGANIDIYIVNKLIPMQKASIVKMAQSEEVRNVDLAVLRFDPPKGVLLPILSFNFEAKSGDFVSAWGYPQTMVEEKGTIGDYGELLAIPAVHAEGIIYGVKKTRGKSGSPVIKYSIPLEEGYSGGPLVNEKGEVLGMNTWCRRSKDDNEYMWSEAQTAIDIARFLMDNGITPKLAPGQYMPVKARH